MSDGVSGKQQQSVGSPITCKAIVAMGSVALHIMFFQLEVISAQVAIAFNIPVQTTSIYLEKLFGIRFLAFVLGVTIEYFIFRIYSELNPTTANWTRVIMNETAFGLMLFARIILFIVTMCSSNLAYHVYFALAFESFALGSVGGSIFAVVPQHVAVHVLSAHLSRLLTFLVQFFLDLAFKDSLPKIKFQFFFCVILNAIACGCFYHYHHNIGCSDILKPATQEETHNKENKETSGNGTSSGSENNGQSTNGNGNGKEQPGMYTKPPVTKNFIETFGAAASPFLMYSIGSVLFDTLFPGILPYAFISRERAHMVNMILPIAGMTGPVLLFILESAGKFDKWHDEFDIAWLWVIPMTIVFIYSILAVHTRIPSARRIINNRPVVLAMTFTGALGNSFMDPLSFAGVAKKLFLSGFIPDIGVLMFHQFFCISIRFYHYKISVGYNVTRIDLGYILPKFRPNHRMSKWNTFWYVLRTTFKKAGRDAISDMTMNVKEYL
ncbi:conserved hypothetical protein [Theileria orientalis strain Shintoku]|uniref:Uncharacterized protein n=1 Tax=Theileria orientalis strain Shintoku TaxID=869250 RepID=J4CC93_THEOR|nr:conserved hypothetical protein [Theileria orientalis strain Shintoku]BAM38992.1 conserved hypothetical protein [Theileria orientalis strain Shintoku]|eukprot:XP_009689293.1 conserved hypothetical protein [Theileria orientalis strain Shintoku]